MIILKMKRLQGLYLLLVLLISACSPDRFDLDNVVNSSFDWVDSEGARTVLRRASQMAMITWTPLRDVPRNGGVFEAGISVTGIPYSSTKQINKYLLNSPLVSEEHAWQLFIYIKLKFYRFFL